MNHARGVSRLLKWLLVSAACGLGACGGGGSDGSAGPAGTPAAASVIIGTGSGQLSLLVFAGPNAPANTVGADGDFFLDTSTGRLYGPKAGGAWPAASISLQGPPGLQGPAGPTGPAGSGGNSLLTGAGVPDNTLGRDGDFYLNVTDKTIVGPKATGAWPAGGISVVGPVGPTGATGATGAAGAPGPTGAVGPAGTSMLSGAGTPSNGVGSNGDFYINTTTTTLFGPKAGGLWPLTGVSLIGPPGPAGAPGPGLVFVSRFAAPPSLAPTFVQISGFAGDWTYDIMATTMPSSCTFAAIYVNGVFTGGFGPNSDTITVTVFKNGVATALQTSIGLSFFAPLGSSSTTTGAFPVVAGDTVALQVSQSTSGSPPFPAMLNVTTLCN